MSESIRSFISFDIEDEGVLKRIRDVQQLLSQTGADLKLIKPQNIHVTIRFLGNIKPSMVDRVFGEMKKVQFTPFDVHIQGMGAFPHLRYLRVVWAGITEGADQMQSIFNQLETGLRGLGFAPESKGFSAHLTIARVKSGRNKDQLVKCIKGNIDRRFGTVRAECLRLKRSNLTPKGPIYSTLKQFCPANDQER